MSVAVAEVRSRPSPPLLSTSWEPPAVPTLVVVPHPDDESLSTGGLIARQAGRTRLEVLAVTDGDAAPAGMEGLPERRRREQDKALTDLAAGEAVIHRLHLPDGRVAGHEDELADVIADMAGSFDLVIAPWTGDQHPDHEATGRAATRAVRAIPSEPVLMYGLFWAWHHARTALPHLHRLDLGSGEHLSKMRAIGRHTSQLFSATGDPVVAFADLAPALWPWEYYVAGGGSKR